MCRSTIARRFEGDGKPYVGGPRFNAAFKPGTQAARRTRIIGIEAKII